MWVDVLRYSTAPFSAVLHNNGYINALWNFAFLLANAEFAFCIGNDRRKKPIGVLFWHTDGRCAFAPCSRVTSKYMRFGFIREIFGLLRRVCFFCRIGVDSSESSGVSANLVYLSEFSIFLRIFPYFREFLCIFANFGVF